MTPDDPYEGLDDAAVLAMARDCLTKEASLEPGSVQRAIAGMAFDSAMAELSRRSAEHVLAKIREHREPGP